MTCYNTMHWPSMLDGAWCRVFHTHDRLSRPGGKLAAMEYQCFGAMASGSGRLPEIAEEEILDGAEGGDMILVGAPYLPEPSREHLGKFVLGVLPDGQAAAPPGQP